jgi:hypothetical protein
MGLRDLPAPLGGSAAGSLIVASQALGDRALFEGRRHDREHGRERCAQLMAQLGQECVFGQIGLLGREGRA